MTELTFFPLGNADTSLIAFRDGRRMLVDFADTKTDDPNDLRCDLPQLLHRDLRDAGLDRYAIVAITHLDNDHCCGVENFFWLDYAAQYQEDGRPKIEELWVPAAAITEVGVSGPAWAIRQEARHRLREGYGIKVFSHPDTLREWLDGEGILLEDRLHCLARAGELVSGLNLLRDGVEVFSHAPHAGRTNDRETADRNADCLVFQMRFEEGGSLSDVLFTGDVDHETIDAIADVTRYYGNDDRLHWNGYHLPHHCSYRSIGPDKGTYLTEPTDGVAWLCEAAGEPSGWIISASRPIPSSGTPGDIDVQPPHRQAANYYRERVLRRADHLLVTMSDPSAGNPKPIVLEVTAAGLVRRLRGAAGVAGPAGVTAPRAG